MKRLRDTEAYTLVELLIAVLIIGNLAMMALPVLNQQRMQAKNAAAMSAVRSGVQAASAYYLQGESYAGLTQAELAQSERSLRTAALGLATTPGAGADPNVLYVGSDNAGTPPTATRVILCSISQGDAVFCARGDSGLWTYYRTTLSGETLAHGAGGSFSADGWQRPSGTGSGGGGGGGGLPAQATINRIAWSMNYSLQTEVWVANADGSAEAQLTAATGIDSNPSFSPDGTKIAFNTSRDGNQEIYVMNADGSAPTRITNHTSTDQIPRWSPDGTKLVFVSNRDGDNEIWLMNADGSSPTQLTANSGVDSSPRFTPDGSKIMLSSDRGGDTEIWQMNADGSSPTQLTNATGMSTSAHASPDGTKILFTSTRDASPNYEVYVMNADGSAQTRITTDATNHTSPDWSPDGSKILWTSNAGITIANPDGSAAAVWTTATAGTSKVAADWR